MKKPFQQRSGSTNNTKGFSLVELLVVIVIMTVLMTMGAMGIRNLTGGKGTSTAVANVEAVFAEARAIAIGKGTSTRVLVDLKDINDQSNYRRRIAIAALDVDPVTGLPKATWSMVSRGYTIPDGTFFSTVFSSKSGSGSVPVDTTTLTFSKASDTGKYAIYEFNSQGICITPGATFVVGSGTRPKGQEPLITGSAKRDFGGFAIWGNGETSTFRNPSQIGDLTNVKNF